MIFPERATDSILTSNLQSIPFSFGIGNFKLNLALTPLFVSSAVRSTTSPLRGAMADDTAVFDADGEGNKYLAAIAGGQRTEGSPRVTELITGRESASEIVRTAIGLEKEAILFYLGIRDLVPERMGKDKVDLIIDEEKRHVVSLTQELKRL